MAIRKLVQTGHLALKTKNKTISSFASPKTKKLIKDLKDTMNKTGLIGIAAPQIAENFMVFLTYPRNTKTRRLNKTDQLRVYINPKITKLSKEKIIIYEGCGSVAHADLFGPVKRSKELTVSAYDQMGNKFSIKCDGILARIIQHEMDHLVGIEFIQKINDFNKILVGEYYNKNIRNSKKQLNASKITKLDYKKL